MKKGFKMALFLPKLNCAVQLWKQLQLGEGADIVNSIFSLQDSL